MTATLAQHSHRHTPDPVFFVGLFMQLACRFVRRWVRYGNWFVFTQLYIIIIYGWHPVFQKFFHLSATNKVNTHTRTSFHFIHCRCLDIVNTGNFQNTPFSDSTVFRWRTQWKYMLFCFCCISIGRRTKIMFAVVRLSVSQSASTNLCKTLD